MLRRFINWFGKGEEDFAMQMQLPQGEVAKFTLLVDKIKMGTLYFENGEWFFQYSEDFKKRSDEYSRIVGFPDLNATYKSETLWPFFQIRIPGLKQPSVQEIIKKEKIDMENQVELLKRFGRKTISNLHELVID
jgi:HipA-like protein